MILAGDVGGTKTLLGLFSEAVDRPSPIEVGEFVTLDYDGIEAMIAEFLQAWNVDPRHLQATCIGVAGAITSQVARMTNVPWTVDGAAMAVRTGIKNPRILNDLEALAYAVRGPRAERVGHAATGCSGGGRKRRRHCGWHGTRRSVSVQRRGTPRAGRLGRRARRLLGADAPRTGHGPGPDARLRPRQRGDDHLGSGTREHLPVHP